MLIKNYYRKIFLFLIIVFSFSLFEGCTFARVFTQRNATFITVQDSTTVAVEPTKIESWHKVNDHNIRLYHDREKISVHKKAIDTLTSSVIGYNIRQYKKGYLPSLTPISRTRFNGVKILDFAIPGLYFYALISMKVSSEDPSYYPLYYYASSLGVWFSFLPGPWATYKSTFRLPALVSVKYRENTENRICVKDVVIDSVNTFKPEEYKSFGTYQKHIQKIRDPHDKGLFNTDLDKDLVKDELNKKLRDWGYVDTSGLFSRVYSNSYIAKCEVQSHSTIYVGSYECVIVKCLWVLLNPEGNKELFRFTSQDTSMWAPNYSTSESAERECVVRSMNTFLKNADVTTLLKQNYVAPKTDKDTISKAISITLAATDTINNLQDALQAVVTIKQNHFFFSGCIISPDGYVVTNAHLLSDATNSDIYVHFSDGDSSIAKFVRINSVYDMVLYKIEKPGHYKCFLPDSSLNIKLGEEVYVIGTAEELNLKQTMTKGIVSGKRKINDRILIQTDASINRGSSGGALVNKNGHLMGIINSRLVGDAIQGIGFATPAYYINNALKLNAR